MIREQTELAKIMAYMDKNGCKLSGRWVKLACWITGSLEVGINVVIVFGIDNTKSNNIPKNKITQMELTMCHFLRYSRFFAFALFTMFSTN